MKKERVEEGKKLDKKEEVCLYHYCEFLSREAERELEERKEALQRQKEELQVRN